MAWCVSPKPAEIVQRPWFPKKKKNNENLKKCQNRTPLPLRPSQTSLGPVKSLLVLDQVMVAVF